MSVENCNSDYLSQNFLSEYERSLVTQIAIGNENESNNYSFDELWLHDSSIGGIGAYSMPADPKKNPFKGGYTREVFRSLQYARCNIDILDINYTTRNVIRDIGLHLEFVLKYILKRRYPLKCFKYTNMTLGRLSHEANNKKVITIKDFEALSNIVNIYNHSKHNVNMDENKDGSFSITEAITFYISVRKIATKVLKPYYPEILIELERKGIADRFLINMNIGDRAGFIK